MKKEHVMVGRDLLLALTNHWAVVAIAITLTGAFHYESTHIEFWIALWLIPVYYYITREKVHNFYLFFIAQLMPVVLVFSVKVTIGVKLIWLLMTVFYMVTSIQMRLKEYSDEFEIHPAVAVLVFGGGYFLDSIYLKVGWGNYYFTLIFVYLICYFLCYFVTRYLNFITVNRNTASNIPEREIFISGMKQTVVCIAGGVLFMLLSTNVEWMAYIMNLIKQGLRVILKFMVYLFNLEKSDPEVVASEQSSGGGMGGGLFEITDPHPFWIFLEKVAMVAVLVGSVFMLILAIKKGYLFLRNNFRERNHAKMKEITGNQDIRESCEIENGTGEQRRWFSFLNNTEKVRKMYRKRIAKNKEYIIGDRNEEELAYLTAKECCDKIHAERLKDIYEKARYSNEVITADDVKIIKAAEKAAR